MSAAPTGLPVEEVVGELAQALTDRGTAVLVAPPGAGKTTVVPLRLLDAPWLESRRIVVLEPRRLAARAAAVRMADLLGEPLGRTVGFRTARDGVGGRGTRIEVVTEGILVRRLQADPALADTGLVVLDEVHERNLTTDLSLALTLDARAGLRPDLRVLAMSATVDADRFAAVLGDDDGPAPIVISDGRAHPVELRWRPPGDGLRPEAHLAPVVAEALTAEPTGDVLVFLPGAAEIGRAVSALRGHLDGVTVLPLHGSLPTAEQDRALAPSAPGTRRVVVATDIAESSLTVAGVRIVVDAGLARLPRFDPGLGRTRLVTEPASQASAAQRAGRAGRLAPGVAYRLWSEADQHRRPAFAPAEITTTDLAGFALELAVWGTTPQDLALVDPVPARTWAEAVALLRLLDALDSDGRPTATGRRMANLPLHPRLAHVLVTADDRGIGWTGALLAAVLDGRDVVRGPRRERPVDLVDRVRAVAGETTVLSIDRDGARAIAANATDLARRARIERGQLHPDEIGLLVAAGYPDRIAQARGGGGFRLRDGGGGRTDVHDPAAGEEFLAVAELDADGDGRIRTAAALDRRDLEAVIGDQRVVEDVVRWDEVLDDLRRRQTVRAGAIVLSQRDGRAEPGPETAAALVERVRTVGLAALDWTDRARTLRDRLAFLGRTEPDGGWPAVDDATLLATLDDWLGPHLVQATGRRDLVAVDLVGVLTAALDWDRQRALDHRAPVRIDLPNGRRLSVDYADAERGPVAAVRVQDLYGVNDHPTVGAGRVPVVLELLSPAGRPVQVTADLVGFWAGSWREVRKEMAGRYPKHPWPEHPATAAPPERRRP